MTDAKAKQLSRTFFIIGITGILVVFSLNLFTNFMLGKPAAIFFSSGWWSQWFPAYAVWPTCLILGFVFQLKTLGSNADSRSA